MIMMVNALKIASALLFYKRFRISSTGWRLLLYDQRRETQQVGLQQSNISACLQEGDDPCRTCVVSSSPSL
jgi:hypothetical protein